RRVEDPAGLAERTQRRAADAEEVLHLLQATGLLHAAQAGEDRVEEIEQQQGAILVEKELAITGAIACGADVVEAFQQRHQQAKVLEALEVARAHLRPAFLGHKALKEQSCQVGRKKPPDHLSSCIRAKVKQTAGRKTK